MLNLEEFIISDKAVARIGDGEIVSSHLASGKPMQQLFGFTNEALVAFYQTAKEILEEKRFDEAISAFVFLTAMNPFTSSFWLGLGVAYQKSGRFEEAMKAFSEAINTDPGTIRSYVFAVRCCQETRDYDKAKDILSWAEHYAEKNLRGEKSATLKKEVLNVKAEVLRKEKEK